MDWHLTSYLTIVCMLTLKIRYLNELALEGNPVAENGEYRDYIIYKINTLKTLVSTSSSSYWGHIDGTNDYPTYALF